MDPKLMDELTAELLTPPPPPWREPRQPGQPVDEPASVKLARLRQLDRDLNPESFRPKHGDAVAWALSLRGRICDLPVEHLDRLARCAPLSDETEKADRQINRRV